MNKDIKDIIKEALSGRKCSFNWRGANKNIEGQLRFDGNLIYVDFPAKLSGANSVVVGEVDLAYKYKDIESVWVLPNDVDPKKEILKSFIKWYNDYLDREVINVYYPELIASAYLEATTKPIPPASEIIKEGENPNKKLQATDLKLKNMKKSDLKTGYKVQLRNNQEFTVMLNCQFEHMKINVLASNGDHMILDNYSENMLSLSNKNYDIIKIYNNNNINAILNTDCSCWNLIWEREDKELQGIDKRCMPFII